MRRVIFAASAVLALVSALVSGCSESNVDACIRNCERQFPHDGAARASCQLDCSSRRATGAQDDASVAAD